MTVRSRKLLDISHEAPCFLNLAKPCGDNPSVPCHSDQLRHGRGVGHKSHDCLAIPGCPACHALFSRSYLGKGDYDAIWGSAFERYQVWLWENEKVKVA